MADASMRATTGGDVLAVARPIGLIAQAGTVNFTIASDAFAHTDPNATVRLTAQRADGTALPDWLNFDPRSGNFEGTPPADASGLIDIQIIARDSNGREAMQVFRIEIGEENLQLERMPESQQPPPAEDTEAAPETTPEAQQQSPEQQGGIDLTPPFKAAANTGFIGKVSLTQQLQQASISMSAPLPIYSQGMN